MHNFFELKLLIFTKKCDTGSQPKIDYSGRPLNKTQVYRHECHLATKNVSGLLLIDLDPKTSEGLRYSSNIVLPIPTNCY